jgi:hypothetical protein
LIFDRAKSTGIGAALANWPPNKLSNSLSEWGADLIDEEMTTIETAL